MMTAGIIPAVLRNGSPRREEKHDPFSIVFLLSALILAFILLLRSRTGFERILYVSLISTLIAAEIVLYAVYAGEEMYLDVALVFALLGFMDVQFFSVYLRRKGNL